MTLLIGTLVLIESCIGFTCTPIKKTNQACHLHFSLTQASVWGEPFPMKQFMYGYQSGWDGRRGNDVLTVFSGRGEPGVVRTMYFSRYSDSEHYQRWTCSNFKEAK